MFRLLCHRRVWALGAVFAALTTAPSASAALITFQGPATIQGSGHGTVNTILTLQSPGNSTTETGAVAFVAGSDFITGDAFTGSSQTKTVTQTALAAEFPGFTFATHDLQVVLNLVEPGSENPPQVNLLSLVLTFYNSAGAVVDTATLAAPILNLQQIGSGTGQSGTGFLVTNINPTAFRVGMSSSLSDAQGGPETYFVGDGGPSVTIQGTPVVPAPAGLVLAAFGMPLLGAAGWLRRRPAVA